MEASGVGAIRQRPQPNSGAQDQQKGGLQTAAARWRLAAGIGFSRSKQTAIHKPLRRRACPSTSSARAVSTRASSKRTIAADGTKHQKKAVAQPSDDHPQPRSILDSTPAVTLDQHEAPSMAPSMAPSNDGTPKPVKGVAATAARGGRPSAAGADLILIGGRFGSTALPRSGSAPSTSAIMLTKNPVNGGSTSVHKEKNRVPLLGGTKKGGIWEPGSSPTPTTLSCWDESGDAGIVLVEAATPPQRHGAVRSWDGQVGNSAAVSQNGDKDALPLWTASASGAGWKDAPLASQHDEPLGKTAGKRKQLLLSPLRRRKSDVADSKRVHTARVEAASATPKTARGGRRSSDSTLQTPQLSQANNCRLLRGDIAPDVVRVGRKPLEARQRDTIQNLRASRPSTHAGRWGESSGRFLRNQAGSDERVGQGQLKARTRVMEWKRRQSDGLKANVEEVVTLEQRERAEAALEAARKLAATRAEEAERRLIAERENTAGIGRAADVAEKWAKHSLERRRRRAEIYAINAIMRAAFEKDFKAYSLEKERQAQEASPITS